MLKGFKDFILRGNVLDLAVAFIMGTAFTAVVTALVESVLMPAISMLVQAPNFDSFLVFAQKLNERVTRNKGEEEEEETELTLLKEIRDSLAKK